MGNRKNQRTVTKTFYSLVKELLFDRRSVSVFQQNRIMRKHRYFLSYSFTGNKLMNEEVLLSQLEEMADKLEILVRDENINIEESSTTGGLCRIEGKYVLILNSHATVKEKIQVMIKALQQFDLSDVYVKPVIRDLLEGYEK